MHSLTPVARCEAIQVLNGFAHDDLRAVLEGAPGSRRRREYRVEKVRRNPRLVTRDAPPH